MAGRELAAHVVVAMVLLMPSGVLAQLPDAPTPAESVQGARHLQADGAAFQDTLEREWVTRKSESPTETVGGFSNSVTKPQGIARLDQKQNDGNLEREAGPRSTRLWLAQGRLSTAVVRLGGSTFARDDNSFLAFSSAAFAPEPDGFDAQQSFARSPKRQFRPTFSSSTAYERAIPGRAPSLQNTCPVNFCPVQPLDMCCQFNSSPFEQYLNWPDTVPLTAQDNLRSAVRGVIDPFNLMTIAADAAIGIGSDSHTVYGPGFEGFAKYTGVSLTEDMTGEFFGTFLVPSLMHQDPHYHRQPFMSIKRRLLHTFAAVVWSQSYTGKPMFNYANIVGGIATAVVSNTFVPGPNRQGFGNTAQRLALAFAISPSGNMIEEFVPDLASHVNLRVVIFQRILNSVTLEESGVAQ